MYHGGGPRPRILLLGATGRVGRLLRAVWREPAELIAVARSTEPGCHTWSPGQDASSLPPVDAVAALWGVTPGEGRDLSDNVKLAAEAQALGAALGARVVLHASSVAIYAPSDGPCAEHAPRQPQNPYGASKCDMEDALAERPMDEPRPVALRIGSVAGAESLFASLAQLGAVTLDRFGDGGSAERSYIAPSDLARVITVLASTDPGDLPDVLNVGAPRPVAMGDIVTAAGRDIVWRDAPGGARQRVTLDTGRLQALCPLPLEASKPTHLIADWRRVAGRPA